MENIQAKFESFEIEEDYEKDRHPLQFFSAIDELNA